MNPLAVALVAYVLMGLELAMRPALALGQSGIAPWLLLPLVVFVAMFAQAGPTLWFALAAGAAMDLTGRLPRSGGLDTVVVLGPQALGFMLAAYLVLQLRGLVIRGNPFSLAILSFLAGCVAAILAVAVLTLRHQLGAWMGWPGDIEWSARAELFARLGSSVYTGLISLVLALVFRRLMGLMGLADPHLRRYGR